MASQEVLTALDALHRELEKLEPAIKHVEIAHQVIETVKIIPQKHLDLINAVKENDLKYKDELKELLIQEISSIIKENKKISDYTSKILEQLREALISLGRLTDTIRSFHDKIDGIHFPERLDKLDANVAGIMVAVQTTQRRLESLERNISDRLKENLEFQKETRNSIQISVASLAKKQKMNSLITWILIIIGFGILALVLKLW
jgi:hypothetical protein